MCRRCGEPDLRGNSKQRRRSRQKLLEEFGNGTVCPCLWCGILIGEHKGYLAVAGRRLAVVKLERDRLMPSEGYAQWNLVPSCGPCNRRRFLERIEIPEGCWFGPVRALAAA